MAPDDLRLLTERGRHHDGVAEGRLAVSLDRLGDALDEGWPGAGQFAADHDALGIAQVAHVGQRRAQRVAHIEDDAPRVDNIRPWIVKIAKDLPRLGRWRMRAS